MALNYKQYSDYGKEFKRIKITDELWLDSAALTATTLANATTSDVLYYNSATGAITYGAAPAGGPGGSISDGDKGDITVSNSGATWTVDADTVVKIAGAQTISGKKTFSDAVSFGAGIEAISTLNSEIITFRTADTNKGLILDLSALAGFVSLQIPNANGTIATQEWLTGATLNDVMLTMANTTDNSSIFFDSMTTGTTASVSIMNYDATLTSSLQADALEFGQSSQTIYGTLQPAILTVSRLWTLPNSSGTLATQEWVTSQGYSTGGGGSSTLTSYSFTVGVGGAPANGADTYTNTSLIGKNIMVYRDGKRAFIDTVSGYQFNSTTGVVTFYPSLSSGNFINIDVLDVAASSVSYTGSIALSGSNVSLVNDATTPGNNMVYSTNASGVKGWYAAASGVTTNQATRTINYIIDGGGNIITTGSKGYIELDNNATIQDIVILADVSGSIVVDIKRATYANWPTTTSIVGAGNKPTLSGAQKGQITPSGWTSTTLVPGDILEFNVDSVATIKKLYIAIKILVS